MDFKKKSGIREMMEKNHPKWHFRRKRRGREEYIYTQKNSPLSENWVNEVFSEQERRYIVATDVEKEKGYTMRMPTQYNNFNMYSISAYENPYEERDYPAEYSYHVWMQEIASTKNGFTITEGTDAALLSYDGDDSEVIIPDGVKIIDGAFEGCSGLTSVTIPDSVTSIGNFAFSFCESLENVYITDISKWCAIKFENTLSNPICYAKKFYLNNKLVTNLIIPDGVKSIGECAFAGCRSLTSVTIPNSVDFISAEAFESCSGLTSITIPDSVTHISLQAFAFCSGLTSITIPDSVTSIGYRAFYDCSGLKSVTIPNSITSIDNSTFSGCSGLTSITIPDSITFIDELAFSRCSSLTSVTIPDSVTEIGNAAFYKCSGLKSVTIPDSIISIGKEAFEGCDLREINTNSYIIKSCISDGMSYLKNRMR